MHKSNLEYFLILDSSELLEILKLGQSIIDKKLDIDGSKVEFNVSGKSVTLIISDGSMYLKGELTSNLEESISDSFAVSISILYDLVRKIDEPSINFNILQNNVSIAYPGGVFSLLKSDAKFHQIEVADEVSRFEIKAHVLAEMLKATRSTIAVEDIRQQFKGIIAIADRDLTLWSTDGHKLSMYKSEVQNLEKAFQSIFPRKFIDCIGLVSNDESAKITVFKKHVSYQIQNIQIVSPLINASVIDYKSIVKDMGQFDIEIEIDAAEIIKKLERVMIIGDESGRVNLKISKACVLHCTNVHNGESFETLNTIFFKNTIDQVSFNGFVILSFLKNFKGAIKFLYSASNKTILVKKNEYPIYITKSLKEKRVDFYE